MKNQIVDTQNLEGRKFRFLVGSAEDAAHIIRERLGSRARVLSVKQVVGKGFSRFLAAPQLEIIVTVPAEEETKSQVSSHKSIQPTAGIKEDLSPYAEDSQVPVPAKPLRENMKDRPIGAVLDRAGFDTNFLTGLRNSAQWANLEQMNLAHGLVEVADWMKEQYKKVAVKPLGRSIAFLGLPGAGTTTAIAKQVASDVLVVKKSVQVLKLESDSLNADNTLGLFCDAMGVPLYREGVDEDKIDQEKTLYLDVPGCSLSEQKEWLRLGERLNALKVDSRVLVINAAYDIDVIKDSFRLGDLLSATHVVFTNLDQVRNFAKLWPFVLHGRLPILFLSHSKNTTSDVTQDPFDYLMHRTFPSILLN